MSLSLELREIIASNLNYKNIKKLCSLDNQWRKVCLDNKFWKELIRKRFETYVVLGNPEQYYAKLESFTHNFLYITITFCSSKGFNSDEIEEVYSSLKQRFFSFYTDLFYVDGDDKPLYKEYYVPGRFCTFLYFRIVPKIKYYTEEEVINFYELFINALQHDPYSAEFYDFYKPNLLIDRRKII